MDVTLEFVVRTLGRIGFFVLLIGTYRLWHLPILRKHSYQILVLIITLPLLSLLISLIDYYFIENPVITVASGTLITWILAVHLNWRASKIRKSVSKVDIEHYNTEIDKKIEEMKSKIN